MAAWEPEVPSGSEEDSVPSPRGTGWWLGASWTAAALAKEAEVQGGAPAGTGAGLTVHGSGSQAEAKAWGKTAPRLGLRGPAQKLQSEGLMGERGSAERGKSASPEVQIR